ncbi:MAG TPA: hypothetical protein VKM55_11650 [Candidatus Lokiarchaeia archaeon]|nr:hypothetical protein [Candidatus Lokiarchaeia archaeon]
MAKKGSGESWLIFPSVHSTEHSQAVEDALVKKAQELFGEIEGENFKFFLLTGGFLGSFGFTYSSVRYWPGTIRPEAKKSSRRPVIDAVFSCLAIYLSGLVAYQTDYDQAYAEILDVLEKAGRPDLADIVEEKLPFVSMPPKQMLKEGQTPVTPYYLIKNDEEILLAELYPSVQLTEIVDSIRSRYMVFFSYQGFTAYGFFDNLPENARFGFGTPAKNFEGMPDENGILQFIEKDVENLKDLFVALVIAHSNSMLMQYKIEDYESLLNKILEYKMEEVK